MHGVPNNKRKKNISFSKRKKVNIRQKRIEREQDRNYETENE
jgi:hypothetical protein